MLIDLAHPQMSKSQSGAPVAKAPRPSRQNTFQATSLPQRSQATDRPSTQSYGVLIREMS